jgi:hypothetical protein
MMERAKMACNKILAVFSIGLMFFIFSLGSAFAFDKLYLVANQKSLDLAKEFLTTLNNESIPLSVVMDQFEKVKKEKYIIVLGGAKGPGSVEEFINQVLTPEEQKSGNEPAGKIFVKENVFAQGQVIIVFTGQNESSAADARKNSRKTWWSYLAKWFEVDTSSPMVY